MNRNEVGELLKRIKSHYSTFVIDDFKLKEWHSYLKDYAKDDVNKKLEQHFKSQEYGSNEPKLHFLINYLKTIQDKTKQQSYFVNCQHCDLVINYADYEEHIDKCSSIKFINENSLKYFGKEIDKDKYWAMSEEEFNDKYDKLMNLIKTKSLDKLEQKRVDNYFDSKTGLVRVDEDLYRVGSKI